MKAILAAALLLTFCAIADDGRADDADVCRECHLSRASPVTDSKAPALAGQHPAYIVRQLERFASADKDDPYRRINTAMAHTLRELERSKWQGIAETLSAEECPFHGNETLPTLTPNACASCHGARGLSGNPDIPNLAGQDARYLFYQYLKLREPYEIDIPGVEASGRSKRLHPVMGSVAAQLHDGVVAVMSYYSKLPCR